MRLARSDDRNHSNEAISDTMDVTIACLSFPLPHRGDQAKDRTAVGWADKVLELSLCHNLIKQDWVGSMHIPCLGIAFFPALTLHTFFSGPRYYKTEGEMCVPPGTASSAGHSPSNLQCPWSPSGFAEIFRTPSPYLSHFYIIRFLAERWHNTSMDNQISDIASLQRM